MPYGVQSGEVGPHEAVVWSATDRPARMLVEWATTDTFTDARRVPGPAALPETGYAAKVTLADLPAGQHDLLSRDLPGPGRSQDAQRAGDGAPPDGAGGSPRRELRLVGGHRRPGLGHQRRVGRHEALRRHAPHRARLLRPQRRHDLRGRPHRRRGAPADGRGVEEPGHRGEGQGGGDPRRVPGQLQVQPHGRARPALQRRGRASTSSGTTTR